MKKKNVWLCISFIKTKCQWNRSKIPHKYVSIRLPENLHDSHGANTLLVDNLWHTHIFESYSILNWTFNIIIRWYTIYWISFRIAFNSHRHRWNEFNVYDSIRRTKWNIFLNEILITNCKHSFVILKLYHKNRMHVTGNKMPNIHRRTKCQSLTHFMQSIVFRKWCKRDSIHKCKQLKSCFD